MVAEGLVVILAAALAARVLTRRAIWVEVRAHPIVGAIAAVSAGALVALLASLAMRSETSRHVIVGAIAVVSAAALWRGSPRYGRSRRLPPGSLALATSLDAVRDPLFYRHGVERWGRVFKMSQVHQPVVCVADLQLAHDFFRDNAAHLGQSGWSFNRLVPRGYIEYMRGETHAKYRATLGAAFAATDMGAIRDVVAAVADAQLLALAEASRTNGVDPEPFLLPASMASLLRGILGVTPDHPRCPALTSLVTALIRPMELYLPVPARHRDTYAALVREVRALGDAIAADGTCAPPSVLLALVTHDAHALDDGTVVGNLVLMVKEGSIMGRGLLRWVLKMHCEHPEWGERLRALPSGDAERERLARNFVLETLRLHESRYVYRTALRDLELGDYRVPRGWLVRLCVGEAHERSDRFPDPQRFDPARFDGDPLARSDYAPFGRGTHECLGADLTIEIARGFLLEAVEHFDVRTVADGPPWRINRHWGLWRPSQSWRVVVTPARVEATA